MVRIRVEDVKCCFADAHRVICPNGRNSRLYHCQMGVDEMMATAFVECRIFINTRFGIGMRTDKECVAYADRVVINLIRRINNRQIQVINRVATQIGLQTVIEEMLTRNHVLEIMVAPLERLVRT